MAPMVTGAEIAREASCSSRGRNWSIRGTMIQWSTAPASSISNSSAPTPRTVQRMTMAAILRDDWSNGLKGLGADGQAKPINGHAPAPED